MYMYVTCFLAHIHVHDCTCIVLFTPVCLFVYVFVCWVDLCNDNGGEEFQHHLFLVCHHTTPQTHLQQECW